MPFTLIVDSSAWPARFGVMAGVYSAGDARPLQVLSPGFDTSRYADACQHVLSDGVLATSGLYWTERLGERTLNAGALSGKIASPAILVLAPSHLPAALAELKTRGVMPQVLTLQERDGALMLMDAAGQAVTPWWWQDAFGRWQPEPPAAARPATLKLGLIGNADDQWRSYPATLAALGDAAEALGLAIEVRCLDPRQLSDSLTELDQLNGVVLPGGSAMANVPGQIRVATASLASGLPTLGLCLGMQTMATAALRRLPSLGEVGMAEAQPDAPIKTFEPLRQPEITGRHRCGLQPLHTVPGTRMAGWLGAESHMHYNHAFQLNPSLFEALESGGVRISAYDASGAIVDALEAEGLAFWCGVQGHPELQSRPLAPHPLFTAFLQSL